MRVQRVVGMVVKIMIFLIIAIAGFGSGVLYLWNWLMPQLFGFHVITFWQAVGLLGLSWLLFGGWRGMHGARSRRPYWGKRMMRNWAAMSPEEREKFREAMRKHGGPCGPWGEEEPKVAE